MIVQYLHWLGRALTARSGPQLHHTAERRPPEGDHAAPRPAGDAGTLAVVHRTGSDRGGGLQHHSDRWRAGCVQPVVTAANLIGITVPNFACSACRWIFVLSVKLNLLPPSTGWRCLGTWMASASHLQHMIMPVLTLSAYYFGAFSIVYQAEYQDVIQRPFIRRAHAKALANGASRSAMPHRMPSCR